MTRRRGRPAVQLHRKRLGDVNVWRTAHEALEVSRWSSGEREEVAGRSKCRWSAEEVDVNRFVASGPKRPREKETKPGRLRKPGKSSLEAKCLYSPERRLSEHELAVWTYSVLIFRVTKLISIRVGRRQVDLPGLDERNMEGSVSFFIQACKYGFKIDEFPI